MIEEVRTKICTKYGEEKPYQDYPKHNNKLGLRPDCKSCQKNISTPTM